MDKQLYYDVVEFDRVSTGFGDTMDSVAPVRLDGIKLARDCLLAPRVRVEGSVYNVDSQPEIRLETMERS